MTYKKYFAAVCGIKNSGKTTLIENMIRCLAGRGLSAAVIKHDGHDFVCDLPDTDSWRFVEAGACGAAVFSGHQLFVRKKGIFPDRGTGELRLLYSLIEAFPEADVLLVEGCKDLPLRKIEVVRSGVSKKPVSNPEGRFLIVSDLPDAGQGERVLPFTDIEGITDAILEEPSGHVVISTDISGNTGNGISGDGNQERIFQPAAGIAESPAPITESPPLIPESSAPIAGSPAPITESPTLIPESSAPIAGSPAPIAGSLVPAYPECCAVLLAGGKSRRMGRDKAALPWEGRTFLQTVAEQMEHYPEKYLSVTGEQSFEGVSDSWTVLPDRIRDCGPLGGIWTALTACGTKWAQAASCDTPAVKNSFFLKLWELRAEDADIICPVTPDGRMHFTCALYKKEAAPLLEEQLREGDYRLRSLFSRCRVRTVPLRDSAEAVMLMNINTPEEMEKAVRGHCL